MAALLSSARQRTRARGQPDWADVHGQGHKPGATVSTMVSVNAPTVVISTNPLVAPFGGETGVIKFEIVPTAGRGKGRIKRQTRI